MNLKRRIRGNNEGTSAPSYDPYGIWRTSAGGENGFLTARKSMQTILPGVTYWEEQKLNKIQDYIKEQTKSEDCNVPMHMLKDVYSMYVNKDFKLAKTEGHTRIKSKVIQKSYNSLTKILTSDSSLFSQMITKEIGVYLQEVERQFSEEMEKQGKGKSGQSAFDEQIGNDSSLSKYDSNGNGEGEDSDPSEGSDGKGKAPTKDTGSKGHGDLTPEDEKLMDSLDKILEKNESKLEKAIKNAEDKMKDLEEKLGKDVLVDLANSNDDFLEQIDNIRSALQNVAINKEKIKEVLVKILNKSQNYFSKNSITVEESIFDSEELEDLFGLEFLHPIFRGTGVLEVGNESKIYTGKIDLYLDCSGSMGSTENFDGKRIRMCDLVKGIAMVLYRMNMIDKLYFFDGSIYEIKNINEFTILGFNKSGGTDFNKVVSQCEINGRNSVVITDGEDSCDKYASNVFWVGVGGTQFSGGYSGGTAFETYKKTRQCVTYKSGNFEYCK